MSKGTTHQLVAAAGIGVILGHLEETTREPSPKPLIGAGLAALLTNLPDLLEPALHPQHRQFFHSVAFVGLIGLAGYKLYTWEPGDDWEKVLRFLLLVGCGAVLVHLAMDALTKRSLPLVGTI
jgi:membrane-bound metal-dependent hydrolase YbcI (DUF457 family)